MASKYALLAQGPLCVLGNLFTLCVLKRVKDDFDDITKVLLYALTCTYLLLGTCMSVVTPFQYLLPRTTVQFVICKFTGSVSYPSSFEAVILTTCLNLNRYLMIVIPLRYQTFMTIRRAKVIVSVCTLVIFISSLALFPFPGTASGQMYDIMCNDGVPQGNSGIVVVHAFFLLFCSIATLVPLFTSIHTIIITRRQLRKIAIGLRHVPRATGQVHGNNKQLPDVTPSQERNEPPRGRFRARRSFITLLLLNCVVFIGWCPVFVIIIVFNSDIKINFVFFSMNILISCSVTWWHCIVYIVTSKGYRKSATEVFKQMKSQFRCR